MWYGEEIPSKSPGIRDLKLRLMGYLQQPQERIVGQFSLSFQATLTQGAVDASQEEEICCDEGLRPGWPRLWGPKLASKKSCDAQVVDWQNQQFEAEIKGGGRNAGSTLCVSAAWSSLGRLCSLRQFVRLRHCSPRLVWIGQRHGWGKRARVFAVVSKQANRLSCSFLAIQIVLHIHDRCKSQMIKLQLYTVGCRWCFSFIFDTPILQLSMRYQAILMRLLDTKSNHEEPGAETGRNRFPNLPWLEK